jgi:membrane protease YdiL (CAAX protease family)
MEARDASICEPKKCDYCGRENDPTSQHCDGCGTVLPIPVPPIIIETSVPPVIESRRRGLRAGIATLILLAFIGGQFLVGLFAGVIAGSMSGVRGGSLDSNLEAIMPWTIVACFVAGGVAMISLAIFTVRNELTNTDATGAAWNPGSLKQRAFGFIVGLLISLCYLCFAILFGPETDPDSVGPLTKMAMTPGLPQFLWVVVALALAPPIEELLFRGVLYGGFRKSFGAIWAVVLSCGIFVLLHATEFVYCWPAIFGIAGLAAAALWMRLRSKSIGPAIATHFAYNLLIVIVAVTSAE